MLTPSQFTKTTLSAVRMSLTRQRGSTSAYERLGQITEIVISGKSEDFVTVAMFDDAKVVMYSTPKNVGLVPADIVRVSNDGVIMRAEKRDLPAGQSPFFSDWQMARSSVLHDRPVKKPQAVKGILVAKPLVIS